MSTHLLRLLPSIDLLLTSPLAANLAASLSRDRIRDLLREVTEEVRREILAGEWVASDGNGNTDSELGTEIERRIRERAAKLSQPSLKRVINAAGVILHTNLGRAPLPQAAIDAIVDVASGYSNLEYSLSEGKRGHRESHCRDLLARLAGSESAIIANNNAAAVLLVLNTLADGGEVIVSRGELIEIGGSFRIPEVMEKSGARLCEVGTTNRTRIGDYEDAISEKTRLILRVHPSNYRITGFTERPEVKEVADLARRSGIPSFEDLGSGCLTDLTPYGIQDEPVVGESLRAGISVVSFSGDKMLGGPQAGIIAGATDIIDRVRKNPLMRALRVDKMTYAAIEATLRLYERGVAELEVPVVRALATTHAQVEARAVLFREMLIEVTAGSFDVTLEAGHSVIGGGSAPEAALPTVLVAIESSRWSASSLEEQLRRNVIPIIARTERDRILIDLRTVSADEAGLILDAFASLAQPPFEPSASI
jgi:L-seryl-tRNA(Ser) seleniumtransferase